MESIGHDYGAAKIVADKCKDIEPQDVSVILQNCGSEDGNKRKLVRIWASSWDWERNWNKMKDDELKIMEAVNAIGNIADKNGYDLVVDGSCISNAQSKKIYHKCGFKYISGGKEMIRKYSLVKHLKYKIKINLRSWLAD